MPKSWARALRAELAVRHPGRDALGRRIVSHTPVAHRALDEMILDHLGRAWITSMDLYRRVVDDYGTLNERVFYRHLSKLRDSGSLAFRRDGRQISYRRSVSPSK